MKKITSNIYFSTEFRGVNVGFVDLPAGTILIDAPPLPQDAHIWRQQVIGSSGKPILYLVLTDGHPDRLLGARFLAESGRVPLVAAWQAYERASAFTDGFWRSVVDGWSRRCPEAADDLEGMRGALPEIMFTDSLTLRKGGVDVTVEKINGADPGSAWLYFPEQDVIFVGDTLVVGEPPFLEATPDTKAWMNTLTTLRRARFSETTIIPGRGPLSDQSDTRPLSDYLALARRRIRSLHWAEKPKSDIAPIIEELVAFFSVPEKDIDWARRRIKAGLDRLYEELQPEIEED